jgi:predicted RNase H-like HicB family nuclease
MPNRLSSVVKGHTVPNASGPSGRAARALLQQQHDIREDRDDAAYDAAVSEGWPVSREVGVAGIGCTDAGGAAESGGDSLEWHKDDAAGDVWSSLVEDGQQGWFEVQLERNPGGWQWVITHEHSSWGQTRRFEQAKAAAAAQLGRMHQRLPRCEIRPFMENERGRYLITFPGFPGVVASGASPEEAVRRGRDALATYHGCLRPGGEVPSTLDPETGTRPTW